MRRIITAGLILGMSIGLSAVAQDWYHDRDARFEGDQWHAHVFLEVRTDLEHIWSANRAAQRERNRLDKTKVELTELQSKLDQGRTDNGMLNDVIDSIRKSANDERLAPRDRAVLTDDLNRLKDFQANHTQWHH